MKLGCRNYSIRAGEIDLVMYDGNTLVFLKSGRGPEYLGRPEETLGRSKRANFAGGQRFSATPSRASKGSVPL
ncbi:MAG: hypothetical protein Ct9H300mP16_16510 [Pseudomonadota bacterium]|nr:MAG: hypothetical protein Ct9H300mP16_16510 [Pseudomonadota bacterium]